MSNPDKHKPLSAEELFKLLDSTSNTQSNFDGLDDFEKDALEGFSLHSDAKKAKSLTAELNHAISEKVTSSGSSTKNKVIWFSAAASIVLMIVLSVFFFNQSKKDSQVNLALNEEKENQLQQHLEAAKPIETISNGDSNSSEQSEAKSQTNVINKSVVQEITAIPESKTKNTYNALAKDESENRVEGDAYPREKQGDGFANQSDADKKTTMQPNLASGSVTNKKKNNLQENQINDEVAANQKIITISASNTKMAEQEEVNGKADKSVTLDEVKQKTEQSSKVSKKSADSNKANTVTDVYIGANSAPISVADKKMNSAYYVGSELAIRDYIVSYFKQNTITNEASGKFKISGIVDTNGNFKVMDIVQITRNNCNCVDDIKKALNSMTKWVPAIKDDKSVSSSVEFVISF